MPDRVKRLEEELARARARLNEAKAKEAAAARRADTRRRAILGEAVLRLIADDDGRRQSVMRALAPHVARAADRRAIADLLEGLDPSPPRQP